MNGLIWGNSGWVTVDKPAGNGVALWLHVLALFILARMVLTFSYLVSCTKLDASSCFTIVDGMGPSSKWPLPSLLLMDLMFSNVLELFLMGVWAKGRGSPSPGKRLHLRALGIRSGLMRTTLYFQPHWGWNR